MAAAADWMSAASFISLAGGLYLQGFSAGGQPGGLAYVLGWTGGFCLVALLVAPYLRRFGLYTVPDYFGVRYGGRWPRLIAALAAILCSFTYVVAQIYGIGLIASRLTGVQFEIGILLGLGGVLLCSFLGGMRAITWTQVAQYVVSAAGLPDPGVWLAYKQTGQSRWRRWSTASSCRRSPSCENAADRVDPRRSRCRPSSCDARAQGTAAAGGRRHSAAARARGGARAHPPAARRRSADSARIAANRELAGAAARRATARASCGPAPCRKAWSAREPLGGLPPHGRPFAGDPDGTPRGARGFDDVAPQLPGADVLPDGGHRRPAAPADALLHHAHGGRGARTRSAWSLFFIVAAVPERAGAGGAGEVRGDAAAWWAAASTRCRPGSSQWGKVDPSLISVSDVNGDGIVQFGEIRLGADIIMLATPEIGGLPYVVSGLVAAGGLAAALSTADGLLLTISNALVRDIYCHEIGEPTAPEQRVILSKFALLGVALVAAHGRLAQAGGHPAAGVGFVLAGRVGLRPGDGAGHLLARRDARRRRGRHAGRPGGHACTTWCATSPGCARLSASPAPVACGSASCRSRPACSAWPAGLP